MGIVKMSDVPERKIEPNVKKSGSVSMSDIPDRNNFIRSEKILEANRKISDVLKNNQWKGERCFIIGGGPSVNDFNLSSLNGEKVIAVNRAFEIVDADIIYAYDARLWGWIETEEIGKESKEKFNKSKALKIWNGGANAPLPEDIVVAKPISRPGMSSDFEEGIGSGTNSGFGALNIALLLGCSEIYLIGFDFYGDNWHDGYPMGSDEGAAHGYHMQCYQEHSEEIKAMGAKIINCNPRSNLDCFEFGELPEDLKAKTTVSSSQRKTVGECLFVSFYTPEYKKYADNLIKTLDNQKLNHYIAPVNDLGNWDLNTKFKPTFILKQLKESNTPIIWIDADSTIVRLPEALINMSDEVDIAYRQRGDELLSGVVYFANNEDVIQVVKEWQKACRDKRIKKCDQEILHDVLETSNTELVVEELDPAYNYIVGLDSDEEVDPVIEAHRASTK